MFHVGSKVRFRHSRRVGTILAFLDPTTIAVQWGKAVRIHKSGCGLVLVQERWKENAPPPCLTLCKPGVASGIRHPNQQPARRRHRGSSGLRGGYARA